LSQSTSEIVADISQDRFVTGERFGEVSGETISGIETGGTEKGVIIMRDSDDLLYNLKSVVTISGSIGPFIDRNGTNRALA